MLLVYIHARRVILEFHGEKTCFVNLPQAAQNNTIDKVANTNIRIKYCLWVERIEGKDVI